MPIVSRTAIVNYTATEMFRLVTDVKSYPAFLPWCVAARAEVQDDDSTLATIDIAKGPIRQSFTTRNINTPGERVEMHLVRGPFAHLEGCWAFRSLEGNASKVSLEIDFSFTNALMRATFGKVFNLIAGQMVDAFCTRAKVVYGHR